MTRASLSLIAASIAVLITACSEPESAAPTSEMDHSAMNHGEMASDDMHAGMNHGDMDHGAMSGSMAAMEASATGVLNAINPDGGSVNITHPPMPDINWPEMTMDITVSGTVDLSQFSENDAVRFTVRRGRDDVFRIVEMAPAEADQ